MKATKSARCVVAVAAATLAASSAAAGAATFQGLGCLPGGSSSGASAVSADGTVVVGSSASASGTQAFRWTAAGGMVGLGDLSGGSFESEANAVSADGTVVVGGSSSASGYQAFRWTTDGGVVGLGYLADGFSSSAAYGASQDGSIVVGTSYTDFIDPEGYVYGLTYGFYWTASGGMASACDYYGWGGAAYAVSADGSMVVGETYWDRGWFSPPPMLYAEAYGPGPMGFLLPGDVWSTAYGVSADGSVIVGYSAGWEWGGAFRWTADLGMVGLGLSSATAVSPDGSVVLGGGSLWTQTLGVQSLEAMLVHAMPAGWARPSGSAVTMNNGIATVVGSAVNPSGNTEAYIATLPLSGQGDLDGDGVPNDVDNCPVVWNPDQADIDGDGIGDTCDSDMDGDGVPNDADNCPTTWNPDQADIDGNGIGDVCDPDMDGDGVPNDADNCPTTWNPDQADTDADGIGDVCESHVITAWRSVRTHSGLGELAIVLDPTRAGNGSTGPTVESRGTAALGMGLRTIDVDFDAPVTLIDPAAVTVTYWVTSGRKIGSARTCAPVVSMLDADTMRISLGNVPDEACYRITIGAAAIAGLLTGDAECIVRALVGDVDGSGNVANADVKLLQKRIGQPATRYPNCDLNLDGVINAADVSYAKSRIGKKALCPLDAADLLILADSFGLQSGDPDYDSRGDLNGDDRVDLSDLLILAENWGT